VSTLDLVVPAAIVGGCLLLIGLIAWLRRDRTPRWSIEAPPDDTAALPVVDPATLEEWHRANGSAVVTWIAAHEGVLRRLGDAQLAVDLTDASPFEGTAPATDALGESLATHPAPVMRAELSAMQVAAEATLHAVKRGDYVTAERQHLTYVEYRDEWIRRLRQFSLDDPSLAELRDSLTTDEAISSLGEEPEVTGDPADEASNGGRDDDVRLTS
jgi:hypothetical protein